jgi:aspartyl-tRNA(Asn)/glutamyl-tRNA(Gln) amidotransferase subunit B
MREKGNADDYRYFPDPDLPPLEVSRTWIEETRAALPELPAAKRARYTAKLGLSADAADVITEHPQLSAFFDRAQELAGGDAKRVANFLVNEVKRDVSYDGLEATFPVTAEHLVELVRLVDDGTISGKIAKDVYAEMVKTKKPAGDIVETRGLRVVTDVGAIEKICADVVAANGKQAEQYRAGKTALLGYFVGQVMKASQGKASPEVVNATLKKLLGG